MFELISLRRISLVGFIAVGALAYAATYVDWYAYVDPVAPAVHGVSTEDPHTVLLSFTVNRTDRLKSLEADVSTEPLQFEAVLKLNKDQWALPVPMPQRLRLTKEELLKLNKRESEIPQCSLALELIRKSSTGSGEVRTHSIIGTSERHGIDQVRYRAESSILRPGTYLVRVLAGERFRDKNPPRSLMRANYRILLKTFLLKVKSPDPEH